MVRHFSILAVSGLMTLLSSGAAAEGGRVPVGFYPLDVPVKQDALFFCKTEKLAEKIQKLGLDPQNAGAIIENQPCFFLNRFDHIPRRYGKIEDGLLVMEIDHASMGQLFAIVPLP